MLEFKTKRTINGNCLYLIINVQNKTFRYGYFLKSYLPIEISKKDIERLKAELLINEFKEVE